MNTLITTETRNLSYQEILLDCSLRQKQCLNALSDLKTATANELAAYLYNEGKTPYFNRNYVHPRLNELVEMGVVEVIGKKEDSMTHKLCAVYSLKEGM